MERSSRPMLKHREVSPSSASSGANIMNEPCVSCELGTATEVVCDREAVFNGGTFQLVGDRFMHCDMCSDDYYTDDQTREAARRVTDARGVTKNKIREGSRFVPPLRSHSVPGRNCERPI